MLVDDATHLVVLRVVRVEAVAVVVRFGGHEHRVSLAREAHGYQVELVDLLLVGHRSRDSPTGLASIPVPDPQYEWIVADRDGAADFAAPVREPADHVFVE